jgi:hypothetical protein
MRGPLAEALKAAIHHVPVHLRNEFLIIGGTAFQLLGSTRPTEDLDIAASEMAHAVFLQRLPFFIEFFDWFSIIHVS